MPRPDCPPAVTAVTRPVWLAILLVGALACQEDTPSPTGPEALATASAPALAFLQLTGGFDHTCGLTTDNRAYCWGNNRVGQLGDGTTTRRLTPFPVAGTLRFRQLSAADSHTCGVTTDFRAYCWGQGIDGELGDGTATNRQAPAQVAGGRQFRLVEAGQYHSCGVTYPDNRAYCWGYNGSFALGDGTSIGRPAPVAVKGGLQFTQVKAGGFHTCGVTTSKKVFCWGLNTEGQVGDSSKASYRPTPSAVAGNRSFTGVDAGYWHTCGVTTTSRAFCWGNGRDGQLGDGKTILRFWPRAVAGGLSFTRVSTGRFHSCGETSGNRAYCWGRNAEGQLGNGGTSPVSRLTPVAVAGGFTFAQLSTGDFHTCGKTSGSVGYCWGTNLNGELGNGSTSGRRTPAPISGPM